MARKVEIIIAAKSKIKAALASAGSQLKAFGERWKRLGVGIAKAMLAATAAVVGFAAKAVQAFAAQEAAERRMRSAFEAYGEEASNATEAVKAFAGQIQNETGVGDENLINRAAQLRLLGVTTDRLEDATKATVALQQAGMSEAAAIRAVASAHAGEFTMLQRYIPALKSASTETEKAALINEFFARGYQAQADQLDTVGGRWTALKGRIGDAAEQIGRAIVENGTLVEVLSRAELAVLSFTDRVKRWIDSGGVTNLIAGVRLFSIEFNATLDRIDAHIGATLMGLVERVKWFGHSTVVVFRNIDTIVVNTWRNTTDQLGYHLTKFIAEAQGQRWHLSAPDMRSIYDGIEEVPERTREAEAALQAMLDEIAVRRRQQIQDVTDFQMGLIDEVAEAQQDAAQQEQAAANQVAAAQVNPLRALQAQIAAIKAKMAANRQMARQAIGDILAEQRARADAERDWQRNERRAAQLRARQARGVRLGAQQQRWLAAFNRLQQARQGVQQAQQQIPKLQAQVNALQANGRELRGIRNEVARLNKDMSNLLRR